MRVARVRERTPPCREVEEAWVTAWAVVGSSWRRVGGALGYGGGLGRGFSWVLAKVGDGGARERLWPSEGRGEGEGAWRHHGREGEMKIRFRVRFKLRDII